MQSGPQRPKSQGKKLMLFNDKSGSMSGTPFDTLKLACVELADTLFDDANGAAFEDIKIVFYDDKTQMSGANNK
jgi:uncharacterized protein YegL